jgi:hypothetical protein
VPPPRRRVATECQAHRLYWLQGELVEPIRGALDLDEEVVASVKDGEHTTPDVDVAGVFV